MKIYNTLTRKKEEFVPLNDGKVGIYACGPTVYNFIHIGNARPLCVFDVFRRYLMWRGYEVNFVQNFTDVDDKLIRKANEENITVAEVAERYIKEFFTDAKGLNVLEATVHPRATENINEIIDLIQKLMDKGLAYEANGDVYYRTKRFKEYGKLSHQPLDELEAGARINVSEHKEDPMDFALWKAVKPGEPCWDSPWGKGRPGWHIECSAMSQKYIGTTLDIHCGGQDLIFPHHENEIAQSEGASGQTFAKYWMHNGYINVDNRKMSKSLGNFFTVRDVAQQYGYEPIRYLMVSSHYRSPINYSTEIIEQAQNALTRLHNCRDNLLFRLETAQSGKATVDFSDYREQFIAAMDDDLNTSDAVAVIFNLTKFINTELVGEVSKEDLQNALSVFDELCGVLGIVYENNEKEDLSAEIEKLIEERTAARREKNFARADEIRDKLKEMGVTLEDTPQGVKWSINK